MKGQPFICSLSKHPFNSEPLHFIRFNEIDYPISTTSYSKILDEVSTVRQGDDDAVGLVSMVGSEKKVERYVSRTRLRAVHNWRINVDHLHVVSEEIRSQKATKTDNYGIFADQQIA